MLTDNEILNALALTGIIASGLAFFIYCKLKVKTELTTDKGEKFAFDILIWTGGVKANSLLANSGLTLSKSGQIPVNEYLQTIDFPNIFVSGDVAEFADAKTQKKAPGVAQVAVRAQRAVPAIAPIPGSRSRSRARAAPGLRPPSRLRAH